MREVQLKPVWPELINNWKEKSCFYGLIKIIYG